MEKYVVTLVYNNIDDSLYTNERAEVNMDVEVTDLRTAHILAQHLQNSLRADSYRINPRG